MRGRTLNSAYVVLDEAQNTTSMQMKMFLTRLGNASRAVITGDVTQIDLDDPAGSGLKTARALLAGIEGIKFVDLDRNDVVRHHLVRRIIAGPMLELVSTVREVSTRKDYTLRAEPHTEDEVYYVIRGRARFQAGAEDCAVEGGAVLFVAAGVEHRFHDIEEDLETLVFFAPPEGAAARP